jgi:hypothetical protein
MLKRIPICLGMMLVGVSIHAGSDLKPLLHAHAHNDYQHQRPLLDALDHGFCSVEADVHLVGKQLLVAHDRDQVKAERTLQALYLDPLGERVAKNSGRVYAGGPEFTLLVELKSEWRASYPVLRQLLEQHADMLTSYLSGTKRPGAVTVIITGHRSKEMFAGETVRYAALDGDLADLNSGQPADLVPWISGNWKQSFTWRATGPMPQKEVLKLEGFVAQAHQQGRRLRFFGAPDQPAFWREMRAKGVDLINTDDLDGAQAFLMAWDERAQSPRAPAAATSH